MADFRCQPYSRTDRHFHVLPIVTIATASLIVLTPLGSGGPSGASTKGVAPATEVENCVRQTWPYIDGSCLTAARSSDNHARIRLIATDRNAPAMIAAIRRAAQPDVEPKPEREITAAPRNGLHVDVADERGAHFQSVSRF